MIETPANNVKGCLLYNPFDKSFFFRVYKENKEFTEYSLGAEDISIIIDDTSISLYEDPENPDKNKLDWSSKTLGK